MVGWHHQLSGHESDQALGDGEGQGSLVCCSPWSHKASDTILRLNNKPYANFFCLSFWLKAKNDISLTQGLNSKDNVKFTHVDITVGHSNCHMPLYISQFVHSNVEEQLGCFQFKSLKILWIWTSEIIKTEQALKSFFLLLTTQTFGQNA